MPDVTDQRVLRGRRNRAAIVDAVIELVEEGNLSPTADQIAARAGVARRSLYHHFSDLEDLTRAVTEQRLETYIGLLKPIPTAGPFDERREAFVAGRSELAEQLMPVYRASVLVAPNSSLTAEQLAATDEFLRAELQQTFAGEFAAAPPWAIEALDALTSLDGWVRLRVNQRLNVDTARGVLDHALTEVLSATPTE